MSIYRPLRFPAAATAPAPYPSTIIQFTILANGFELPGQSKLKILKIINRKNWSKIVVVKDPLNGAVFVSASRGRAPPEPNPNPGRFDSACVLICGECGMAQLFITIVKEEVSIYHSTSFFLSDVGLKTKAK